MPHGAGEGMGVEWGVRNPTELMKTSIFARSGLALGAALILHQSAAAVSMVANLGSTSDLSTLSRAGNATFSWDSVTQKAKMDSGSAALGSAGQYAGVISGTGAVPPSVGLVATGAGGNSASSSPGPAGSTATTNGPAVSNPSGNVAQVPNSSGTQGALAPSQGSSGATGSMVALPAGSLTTHVASGEEGQSYGNDGVVFTNTLIRPMLVVTAAVDVSEMGGELLLFPFGLVALLAFSARFKKRGSSNTCLRLATG